MGSRCFGCRPWELKVQTWGQKVCKRGEKQGPEQSFTNRRACGVEFSEVKVTSPEE